ncbi:alpha/beta hydrolase fold domain-containing protein [Tomitella fengzijianii]|uniref:Amidohydrolase family protein n=1 Tax=Tomitella fengzijianii TaxID=2597660 RepID=A0A516X5R0_9ACTN|nr:alpha/beta hydrolase fold domain-containing protein [Tomitella fengzijianii]QDQ98428.1 amidohydrolase family protein [Tomitella fengzijianii]
MTRPGIEEAPLDDVLQRVVEQMAQAGAARMVDGTPEQAREKILATAATCAPGPAAVRVRQADASGGTPVRIYRPEIPGRGTIVHFHGGGWVTGDLDYSDAYCRHLAARTGRAVVSVGYRLAPEHPFPAALDDAAAALRWVAGGASGLDADVVLSGDSAGGNLAAVCAASGAPGLRVLGQVLVYPVVDGDLTRDSYRTRSTLFLGEEEMRWFWGHYCPEEPLRSGPRAAPLRAVGPGSVPPPAVLAVGGHDPLRDEGLAYADALSAAGTPAEVLAFPSLPHGFLQFTAVSPAAAAAQDRIVAAAARLCAEVFGPVPAHDLVIRGGTVIDGGGDAPFTADVAVDGVVVTAVGAVAGAGHREIDASGLLVTPGFVDIHTHYDGQVTWDPLLTPSALHGVTTVVMGNCGVGFAPVRAADRDWLIGLMEGVEDIPGSVLAEGIAWDWETFPEYLDAIDTPHAIDFAAQVPHGAVRTYVMGARGSDHTSRPTEDETLRMRAIIAEAVRAGALGWSTSRTAMHKTVAGEPTPSLTAPRSELVALAAGLRDAGGGVTDLISDFMDQPEEMELVRAIVEESGRPASVSITQADRVPGKWRDLLDGLAAVSGQTGLPVTGQVAPRAVGVLLGWELSWHPFTANPVHREIADLPVAERLARLRDPDVRARMLATDPDDSNAFQHRLATDFEHTYLLGTPPNYEPGPEDSVVAHAARAGVTAAEFAYDAMLGGGLLYFPMLNYSEGSLDAVGEMLEREGTVPALGDGGAHCGAICDASFTTTMLTHWGRDRTRGRRFPVEWLVKRHTTDTAAAVGLGDRGLLRPGYRADINVIDFDALQADHPEVRYDLPTGGRRLMQTATGYRATIVAGEVVLRDGEHTGALPGGLVRGARPAPAG